MRRFFNKRFSKKRESEDASGQGPPPKRNINEQSPPHSIAAQPVPTLPNISTAHPQEPIHVPVIQKKQFEAKGGRMVETKVYAPISPGTAVKITTGSQRDITLPRDGRGGRPRPPTHLFDLGSGKDAAPDRSVKDSEESEKSFQLPLGVGIGMDAYPHPKAWERPDAFAKAHERFGTKEPQLQPIKGAVAGTGKEVQSKPGAPKAGMDQRSHPVKTIVAERDKDRESSADAVKPDTDTEVEFLMKSKNSLQQRAGGGGPMGETIMGPATTKDSPRNPDPKIPPDTISQRSPEVKFLMKSKTSLEQPGGEKIGPGTMGATDATTGTQRKSDPKSSSDSTKKGQIESTGGPPSSKPESAKMTSPEATAKKGTEVEVLMESKSALQQRGGAGKSDPSKGGTVASSPSPGSKPESDKAKPPSVKGAPEVKVLLESKSVLQQRGVDGKSDPSKGGASASSPSPGSKPESEKSKPPSSVKGDPEVKVLMESKSAIQQRDGGGVPTGGALKDQGATAASGAGAGSQSQRGTAQTKPTAGMDPTKGGAKVEVLMESKSALQQRGGAGKSDPSKGGTVASSPSPGSKPESDKAKPPSVKGAPEVKVLLESKSVLQQRGVDGKSDPSKGGESASSPSPGSKPESEKSKPPSSVKGDPEVKVLMESKSALQQREGGGVPTGGNLKGQETTPATSSQSPKGTGQAKPAEGADATKGGAKVEVLMESKSVLQQRENDRDKKGRRIVIPEAPLKIIEHPQGDKRVETKVFAPLTPSNKGKGGGIRIGIVKAPPPPPPPPPPKPVTPPPPPPPKPKPATRPPRPKKPSVEPPLQRAQSIALLDYLDHLKDLSEADLEHEESPDEEDGGNVAVQVLKKFGLPQQGKALDSLLNTDSVHFDFGGLMRQYYSFILRSYCLINMQDRYRGVNHSAPCFQAIDVSKIGTRDEEQEKINLVKQRKLDEQRESFRKVASDEDHFQYLNSLADYQPTLLPLTIVHMMNEQLAPVLEDVFRFYGKNLGTEHKCTKEAGFHYMKVRKRCEMYSNICGGSTLDEDLTEFYR